MADQLINSLSSGSINDSSLILIGDPSVGTLTQTGYLAAKNYFTAGITGSGVNTGSLLTTSSFNTYTSSTAGQIANVFSSESNYTPTSSFIPFSGSYASDSASFNSRILSATGSGGVSNIIFNTYTSSTNTQISNVFSSESNYTPTSSFNSLSSSYNTLSSSYSIDSGSFNSHINTHTTQIANVLASESNYLQTASFVNVGTISGSGLSNYQVLFSGSNAITNSMVYQSGSGTGSATLIGGNTTGSVNAILQVYGALYVSKSFVDSSLSTGSLNFGLVSGPNGIIFAPTTSVAPLSASYVIDSASFNTSINNNNTSITNIFASESNYVHTSSFNTYTASAQTNVEQVLVDGSTVTWDMNSGSLADVTLAGNRTLSMLNVLTGSIGVLRVIQDNTGNRNIILPGVSQLGLSLSTGSGAIDVLTFLNSQGTFYWFITNFGTPPDTAAQTFINAVQATGVSLNTTQQGAINTFVTTMKSQNLWSKMTLIYPFIGGTAASHKFNMLNPVDADSAFRVTYTGSWTHDSNGVTPGSNCWMDTKYNLSSGSSTSFHISSYIRTNSTESFPSSEFGSIAAGVGISFNPSDGTGQFLAEFLNNGANYITGSNPTSSGHYILNQSGSIFLVQKNGSGSFGNGPRNTGGVALNTQNLYLNASNVAGAGSGPALRNFCFVTVGTLMNLADAKNLYLNIQALQTSLGRNV